MPPPEEIRRSCSHVFATAVLRLFPETRHDIGPPTKTGFNHDFDLALKFTAADLARLETESSA